MAELPLADGWVVDFDGPVGYLMQNRFLLTCFVACRLVDEVPQDYALWLVGVDQGRAAVKRTATTPAAAAIPAAITSLALPFADLAQFYKAGLSRPDVGSISMTVDQATGIITVAATISTPSHDFLPSEVDTVVWTVQGPTIVPAPDIHGSPQGVDVWFA